MVTFGVYAVIFFAALVLLFFAASKRWGVERAYTWSCWLPASLLAAGYLLRRQLVEALSYAASLVALLIFVTSVVWTLMGLVLVVSLRQQRQKPGWLVPATMLAGLPAVVFIVLLLLEFSTASR